jgi:hypothetical protein
MTGQRRLSRRVYAVLHTGARRYADSPALTLHGGGYVLAVVGELRGGGRLRYDGQGILGVEGHVPRSSGYWVAFLVRRPRPARFVFKPRDVPVPARFSDVLNGLPLL